MVKGASSKVSAKPSSKRPTKKQSSVNKSKKESPSDKKGSKTVVKGEIKSQPEHEQHVRKSQGTFASCSDHSVKNFKCSKCFLVIDSFQQFMNHECWKSCYLSRVHFGGTQIFACRTCERVFQTQLSYSKHTCDQFTPEDILPITYRMHFKFFMYWDSRIQQKSEKYDTDWRYVCRCIKCGNKFKRDILFLLHSCFQYSFLKPIEVKCLKICRFCKFVFYNEAQYNLHLPNCPKKERAFCNSFQNTLFLRTCQQFVLARHCYDFDLYITQSNLEKGDVTEKPLQVGCNVCGLIQDSVLEFLYHPCVAGIVIAPADIEMLMVCNKCHCLFLNYEASEKHRTYCLSESFTFVRLNALELEVALERWVMDILKNPFLPKRPQKMKCQFCLEIFCDLTNIINHNCPKRRRFERLFIPPISLSEMYICGSCGFLFFTTFEAVNHAECCQTKPLLIQIHVNMSEAVTALKVWSKLPRLLQMEINLNTSEERGKCPKGPYDKIIEFKKECNDFCV